MVSIRILHTSVVDMRGGYKEWRNVLPPHLTPPSPVYVVGRVRQFMGAARQYVLDFPFSVGSAHMLHADVSAQTEQIGPSDQRLGVKCSWILR